jgi:hypothetical protein
MAIEPEIPRACLLRVVLGLSRIFSPSLDRIATTVVDRGARDAFSPSGVSVN